ncbi:hypothetical protein HB364_18000 [Pseudoflavitalea sp. X16]|uniref:hypothetical protein n=1 Tax=Paraflavitalea devenefica TaxID=2716334 RepID=UPI001420D3DB|nr:hypothetical protein [Paraflavitalea devenefica]NII26989.1 hypothetical protein [Paraflavitalea devenefica]
MYGEAKKLHLIEEILKIENEAVLEAVEAVISKSKLHAVGRRSFKDFAGTMSDEDANELEKIIEEGCEQIHPDDWK